MIESININLAHGLNLLLLFIALSIFVTILIYSKRVRSFPFLLAIFIIIWIVGEIFHHHTTGNIGFLSHEQIGMWIHIVALTLFTGTMWIRFYRAKRVGKAISESFESILR